MITTSKWLAIVAVAFVAGSFISSPELRAYAANTVFSSDIKDGEVKTADLGGNSVTSGKIKDGEVKASDIGKDAVGGSELKDIEFLKWVYCPVPSRNYQPGDFNRVTCSVPGADTFDQIVATPNGTGIGGCIEMRNVIPQTDTVFVDFVSTCSFSATVGGSVALIVFDD